MDSIVFGPPGALQGDTMRQPQPGYGCIPCGIRQATEGGCWQCGGDTIWTLGTIALRMATRAAEPFQVVTARIN